MSQPELSPREELFTRMQEATKKLDEAVSALTVARDHAAKHAFTQASHDLADYANDAIVVVRRLVRLREHYRK